MRYRPHIYARALREVLDGASEVKQAKLLADFVALVRRNGDGSYFDRIVLELEALLVKEAGGNSVTLEFARQPKAETLAGVLREFGARDRVTVKVLPSLVAGIRMTMNGEKELDNSLARRLRLMFNR